MILANLALVFAVLLVLEVPLALVYTRHEHDALDAALQRDAAALSVLAGEVAEVPGEQNLAERGQGARCSPPRDGWHW